LLKFLDGNVFVIVLIVLNVFPICHWLCWSAEIGRILHEPYLFQSKPASLYKDNNAL